jgi:hypothetical protein
MENKIEFRELAQDSRGQVYLLWAAITGVGYVVTHYYQNQKINLVWLALVAIGFSVMAKIMPMRVKQMKQIYGSWLIPITIGLVLSILSAQGVFLPELIGHLGAFWLFVQAVAFFWNGLVDSPSKWYYVTAGINLYAAGAVYLLDDLLAVQYLIAAVIAVWSMLMLFIFRTDA